LGVVGTVLTTVWFLLSRNLAFLEQFDRAVLEVWEPFLSTDEVEPATAV